jgi:NhaA family Na+:H+ antiporter
MASGFDDRNPDLSLPREPIHRVVNPIVRFMHVEAAAGIVLLACTAAALVLANSRFADGFLAIWKTEVGFRFGDFEMVHSLRHWISDSLMAVFFFVVGLEVKRELVLGELRDVRRATLPVAAALGGMIVPAGIYLALRWGEAGARGWGIPMATDIAFVVGCMAVLGPRVPHLLRIMVLSLAIVDDIGAILVIAIGYTEHVDLVALLLGFAFLGLIVVLGRLGVRSFIVYTILGALVWLGFHESGVHATIAGVLLGLLTPARSYVSETYLGNLLGRAAEVVHGGGFEGLTYRAARMRSFLRSTRESISPLEYLEATLHPWVGFLIVPLFALANAGVPLELADFGRPVAVAVMAGLVIGKPVGIVLASWLAVRLILKRLPEGLSWGGILGAGCLAGIGFTMSLFIDGLALEGDLVDEAKIGILGGSAIAAVLGMVILLRVLPKPAPRE